jgi:DNA methylase
VGRLAGTPSIHFRGKGRRQQLAYLPEHALNAVCPYFTMFPVEFPLSVLRVAPRRSLVADPFCGRGTTAYAARFLGLRSFGIDSSPVAVAIARAKLASSSANRVVKLAEALLQRLAPYSVPIGPFWNRAFHRSTLDQICKLRAGLLEEAETDTAILLRAILLGVLHGPISKVPASASYLSNQMPRTFAPKPDYAVRYWRANALKPPQRNAIEIIRRKAERVLATVPSRIDSATHVKCGDSRMPSAFSRLPRTITHVVTSPPYYGLRTYLEDQWLRLWLLGGPSHVQYGAATQVSHQSPESFAESLAAVWDQVGEHSVPDVRMVVRFGGIGSRRSDPRAILSASLQRSAIPWRVSTVRPVDSPRGIRRQADQMRLNVVSRLEYDFYIRRAR